MLSSNQATKNRTQIFGSIKSASNPLDKILVKIRKTKNVSNELSNKPQQFAYLFQPKDTSEKNIHTLKKIQLKEFKK